MTDRAEMMVDTADERLEFTARDRFWMNNKLFQFFRFVVLNLKILKGVDASKRS